MKKVWFAGAVALFALAAGFSSHTGAQTLQIVAAPPPPTMVFDTSGAEVEGYITLSLSNYNGPWPYYTWTEVAPAELSRTTWDLQSKTSTKAYKNYNVYSSLSPLTVLKTRSGTNPNQLYRYNFTSNGTINIPYYIRIISGQSAPPAGTYIEVLTFGVYGKSSQNSIPTSKADTQTVEASFTVNPAATITITTQDPSGNIVFGDVSAGSGISKTISVEVRSNFRYSLRVASAKGGKMKNPDAEPDEFISYTLTIASVTPVLSVPGAPQDIALNERFTGNNTTTGGKTYSGSLTLGTINAITAGDYTDSLTFTVSAQ